MEGSVLQTTVSIDRLVGIQAIFREVNERIRELADRFDLKSGAAFICECSNENCVESIALDFDEYKAVRSSPTRFVVAPGHETLELENVIETNDRYSLVQRIREVELVTESYHRRTERRV